MRVCLVTEELANVGVFGGIGTAFRELASVLVRRHELHVAYIPVKFVRPEILHREVAHFKKSGIVLHVIDPSEHAHNHESAEGRSYAAYRFLRDCGITFDVVHFHDYRGLGYFPLMAREQGAALQGASVVMQCHGPSFWTAYANKTMFSDTDDLVVDFMERKSIEWADYVVSPSQYLKDFLTQNGFNMPCGENVRVIKNICAPIHVQPREVEKKRDLNEVIFFGRHEDRKGIEVFCRAIDAIADDLIAHNIQITFLGRLGQVKGMPSGLFVSRYASRWPMPVKFITGFDRDASLQYLSQSSRQLVVIASTEENSPYTVAETVALGKPMVCSVNGGGAELIDMDSHAHSLCIMEAEPLAASILRAIKGEAKPAKSAQTAESIEQSWFQLHEEIQMAGARRFAASPLPAEPKVVLGITHFERPEKLHEAVMSALRQTYSNLEIVVVDDCSRSRKAATALDAVESLLRRSGGKVIRRRQNGYLGAARNTIVAETESDYILFLDDDDLAFPNLVSDLVTAALHSQADITNCINLYLDVHDRDKYKFTPEIFPKKVSYFPVGGPVSVTPVRNTLGSATSLIRRSAIEAVGGYTEIHGVGHEDYEFYVRALQAGMKITVLPEPLYLYETGRPSMISSTSTMSNFHRVFHAIDFSANAQDWKDLIGVFTGQVARNHAAARGPEQASDPLMAKIFATQFGDPSQHMGLLARWADSAGASNLAIAWLDAAYSLLTSLTQPFDDGHVNHIKLNLLDQAIALLDAPSKADWIIKFLTHNPIGEALRRIRQHLENHPSAILSEQLLRALQGLTPHFLSQLVSFFSEHHRRADANEIFAEVLGREERAYIDRYDDLYKALGATTDLSGVRHYIRYGRFENRFGFENILRLKYLVDEDPESRTSDIEQLIRTFGVKFRSPAPNKLLFNFEQFGLFEKGSLFLLGREKKH